VTFKLDPGAGGFKLELDQACGTAFPSLKDVGVWTMGPNDEVRLLNSKGVVVLDFMEVESHMYEAESKGEGVFFMRTPAALQAGHGRPLTCVRRMDFVQGIREAALQPHAVERLGRRRKLQDHGQARLRRVGRRYRAFDLAARRRRAAAQRPWRQLALFRKRC